MINVKQIAMKNKNIIKAVLLCFVCLTIFSCSEEWEDSPEIENGLKQGIAVTPRIGTQSLPDTLQCNLYIFWKPSGGSEYTFKESKILSANSDNVLKFKNSELKDKMYRFLFVATPFGNPEIMTLKTGGSALTENDNWSDILFRAVDTLLTEDNYYGVTDKTGAEILAGDIIHGDLSRMVGQLVLDIFRFENNITNPVDIVSGDVSSVLDRVKKIEIVYTGLTKDVVFDGATTILKEADVWADPYTITLIPTLQSDLRVTLPQVTNRLDVAGSGNRGSARIKGICGLPSDKAVRCKFTFYYYDTTPTCGLSDGGNHTVSCFEERKLELNLPKATEMSALLSVLSGYYTVNKAGIRYDRIIDLGINSGFTLDTVWENDK